MAKKTKPKAIPAEVLRERFLQIIRDYCRYWANQEKTTDTMKKLEGLAFSILTLIDGHTGAMPGMDLVMRPHPDDKAFYISQGEDWIKNGMVINKCVLHELFYVKDETQKKGDDNG